MLSDSSGPQDMRTPHQARHRIEAAHFIQYTVEDSVQREAPEHPENC